MGIESQRRIAFAHRLLEQPRETKNVGECEVRASALGPAPDQVACPRVRAEIVAVLGLQKDETDLGLREVRVEREGALLRGRGALQVLGGLRAIQAVLGLVEISLAEGRPGRGICRIEPDGPLEHRHGLLVLPGIAREGLAAEEEVVRFRTLRVRRRSARVGAGAQGRQQALAHALQQLLGQRDRCWRPLSSSVSRQTMRSPSVSRPPSITRSRSPSFWNWPVRMRRRVSSRLAVFADRCFSRRISRWTRRDAPRAPGRRRASWRSRREVRGRR